MYKFLPLIMIQLSYDFNQLGNLHAYFLAENGLGVLFCFWHLGLHQRILLSPLNYQL